MRFLAPIFVGLLCMSGAGAQSYPDRPIKFVVGYAPGGSADFLTRLVAVEMAKEIGVHSSWRTSRGQAERILVLESKPVTIADKVDATRTLPLTPFLESLLLN